MTMGAEAQPKKSKKKVTMDPKVAAADKDDANAKAEEENKGPGSKAASNNSLARYKSKSKMEAEKRRQSILKRTSTKLKQLLPEELYQVHIEFPADAPTRVVVRLERLMGSDKVRLTDTKYMCNLLEKIGQEEEKTLLKRTKVRRKQEWERYKNLAVEGLVEPDEGMEEITDHPVFRMNRILNRLTKMGEELSRGISQKFPPITPIEPFVSAGAPAYSPAAAQAQSEIPVCGDMDEEGEDETVDAVPSQKPLGRRQYYDEEEGEEDEGEEEEETKADEMQEIKIDETIKSEWGGEDYPADRTESVLADAKKRYGIPEDVNLEHKCKPYRSKLVEMVYDDQTPEGGAGGVHEMFDFATEVLGAYNREALTADDFVVKLNRMSK